MRLPDAWDEPVRSYLTWLRASGVSEGSVRLRGYQLGWLAEDAGCGPWECYDDALAAYVARLGWAPETRSSARSAVRGFYRWAVDTGRLERNPAASLRRVRVPAGRPRPAPETAVTAAIAAAAPREALALSLAAYAGLRCTEIAQLRWEDVTDGLVVVHGKGGHVRAVPLHPALDSALRAEQRRRAQGERGHRYGSQGDGGWIFPGQGNGSHMTRSSISRVLSRALPGAWTAHTLRHRFASVTYAHTRDLRTVQTLLGHASPETTARYTAVPDGALMAAVLAAGPPGTETTAA